MEPPINQSSNKAVWADALFVSALQRCEHPRTGEVRQAVAVAVRTFGEHGCAERMAQEFGEHPETAVARMRWARELVDEAFSARGRVRARARMLAHRHNAGSWAA